MLAVVQDAWRTGNTVVSRPVQTGRTTALWHYYAMYLAIYGFGGPIKLWAQKSRSLLLLRLFP